MAAGCTAHVHRVEYGAFNENGGGVFTDSAVLSAEDAGNAHRFFGVANHEVIGVQLAFLSVESDKGFVGMGNANDHFLAGDFIGIEGMKRVAKFMHHIVGDVNEVVDRGESDGLETVLQPSRRSRDLCTCEDNARVAVAGFGVRDFNRYVFGWLDG